MSIEEEFFKTFGIEKRCIKPKDCVRKGICKGAVACDFYTYPEITDRILLELICILNGCNDCSAIKIFAKTPKTLKKGVLQQTIDKYNKAVDKDKFKQQVRSLFEGVKQ